MFSLKSVSFLAIKRRGTHMSIFFHGGRLPFYHGISHIIPVIDDTIALQYFVFQLSFYRLSTLQVIISPSLTAGYFMQFCEIRVVTQEVGYFAHPCWRIVWVIYPGGWVGRTVKQDLSHIKQVSPRVRHVMKKNIKWIILNIQTTFRCADK